MNSDIEAQIDLLKREKFASDIAIGILQNAEKKTDGFVLGLTGRWGSGKTTLMGFIQKELEKKSKNKKFKSIYIEFNPWFFSENTFITKAFLKEFSNRTKTTKSFAKRFSKFIAPILRLLKTIGIWKKFAGDLGNDLGELVAKYLENDTSTQYKKIIDDALIKDDIKIFVFIDDIDRLHPKQIFEVLQLIKLTGNFKNTFFLLAFDREVIEAAIETQFKNYGKNYLEKIIQADFKIPEPLDEVIENIFFSDLKKIIDSIDIQKQFNIGGNLLHQEAKLFSVWKWYRLKGYFHTLRDIYRYFNSIELRLPSIINEIDLIDFIIIEAIRMFDFSSYQLIYQKYSVASHFQTGEFENMQSLIGNNIKNEVTKDLLTYLFPKENYFNISINEKRLFDHNNFYKYFTFIISDKDISENDFKALMELEKNRQAVLKGILLSGRMENLLRRLNDQKLLSNYTNWGFSLIEDLYHFISVLVIDHEEHINSLTDAITHLLSLSQKRITSSYKQFYELLASNKSRIDYGALYFYHWITLEADKKNTNFSYNSPEFKNSFIEIISELKLKYRVFLNDWSYYFLTNPIPYPSSYFTMLFIYDYAKEYREEYISKIKELAGKKENTIFFLKNILRIDSTRNEAFQIDMTRQEHYLPGETASVFSNLLLQIQNEELEPNHRQWKKFYLSSK